MVVETGSTRRALGSLTLLTSQEVDAIRVAVVGTAGTARDQVVADIGRFGMHVEACCCAARELGGLRRSGSEVVVLIVDDCLEAPLAFARALRIDPELRSIPVIVVGTDDRESTVVACLEAGAIECVSFPLRQREFELRIRVLADMYRARMDLVRSNDVRGELSRALGILFELSRGLSVADTLDMLLEQTLLAAVELTGAGRVALLLPDAQRKTLRVAGIVGLEQRTSAPIKAGTGLCGHAFVTGETLVAEQPSDVRGVDRTADAILFNDGPLLVQPLCSPEQVIGVLSVSGRHEPRSFDARDLEYMDLICNIAASALDDFQSRCARDEARDSIVVALATLAEYRDADTGRHLDRVTEYAMLLAEELRKNNRFRKTITPGFMADLRRAMPLHDVGKVAVPDQILLKPGRLTDEEMTEMKTHTTSGAKAIRSVIERSGPISFLLMAERIAMQHHEWYDGSGYPCGLQREEIALAARIAAVADVYDALTTRRPYKEPMSHEKSLRLIQEGAGTHFDPAVAVAFLACQDEFARLANELADPIEPAQAIGCVAEFEVPAEE